MKRPVFFAALVLVCLAREARPCTIVSGRAADGTTWIANNEDWWFTFDTYLNVLPREGKDLGAVSFTYGGPDTGIQGGLNEAGLFFDWNALPPMPLSTYVGFAKKKDFPGGEEALVRHILRRCETVDDALKLLRRYRMPGLLEAQLHLADRSGHLAVVAADGSRESRGGHQISTNFDVVSGGAPLDGKTCWRYPIAERVLAQRGVSAESFVEILDATHQPKFVGTIYSYVANLSKGRVSFYYAGDFASPYRFDLGEMLAKGHRSLLMRDLFPESPLVRAFEVYRGKGAEAAVTFLRENASTIPPQRLAEIRRHLFSACLFSTNAYDDARTFFDAWSASPLPSDEPRDLYGAYVALATGDRAKAEALFARQVEADALKSAEPSRAAKALARLRGEKPRGANAHFTLEGHLDARLVSLFLTNRPAVFGFFNRTPSGWEGDFVLPEGDLHYAFMVDGKLVLDPKNPKTVLDDGEDGKRTLNARDIPPST